MAEVADSSVCDVCPSCGVALTPASEHDRGECIIALAKQARARKTVRLHIKKAMEELASAMKLVSKDSVDRHFIAYLFTLTRSLLRSML